MRNKIRRITSHYVLTPQGLVQGAILSFDSNGTFVEITYGNQSEECEGVEFFSGILIPGMVNAHCHTELSYLKGKIERGCTFGGFADKISSVRHETPIQKRTEVADYWDSKQYSDGVTAVGDICNSSETFDLKRRSKIYYHNFIEYFGLQRQDFSTTDEVLQQALALELNTSATPHSIYSLADQPFKNIASQSDLLSIHFMESQGEEELFDEQGPLHQRNLRDGAKVDFAYYGSPAQRIVGSIPRESKLLLIHNTFATLKEINIIENHVFGDVTWVLCPRSNSYIEGATPPYELLLNRDVRVAVGTDSLASNETLSMIEELKMFKNISLKELFTWATINGAKALGIDSWAGSFEVGKTPGAVLITGIDWEKMTLKAEATSRRIL